MYCALDACGSARKSASPRDSLLRSNPLQQYGFLFLEFSPDAGGSARGRLAA
jgi:hypothetical protein